MTIDDIAMKFGNKVNDTDKGFPQWNGNFYTNASQSIFSG